jgi:hypothetical protein
VLLCSCVPVLLCFCAPVFLCSCAVWILSTLHMHIGQWATRVNSKFAISPRIWHWQTCATTQHQHPIFGAHPKQKQISNTKYETSGAYFISKTPKPKRQFKCILILTS